MGRGSGILGHLLTLTYKEIKGNRGRGNLRKKGVCGTGRSRGEGNWSLHLMCGRRVIDIYLKASLGYMVLYLKKHTKWVLKNNIQWGVGEMAQPLAPTRWMNSSCVPQLCLETLLAFTLVITVIHYECFSVRWCRFNCRLLSSTAVVKNDSSSGVVHTTCSAFSKTVRQARFHRHSRRHRSEKRTILWPWTKWVVYRFFSMFATASGLSTEGN